ncbi:MAG: VTC domain-containing protein [Prevotella sp.]|nr:VTC domain-containing protein [Prevotella sp.]
MQEILNHIDPITLADMKDVKLMNRTDTKFVTTLPLLRQLLTMAGDEYYAQEIDGKRIAPYYTVYFDTPDNHMYTVHETGHTNRQKLRIRCYVESGLNFLEVKTKNNKKRTKKKRVQLEHFDPMNPRHDILFTPNDEFGVYTDFLHEHLRYDPTILTEQLENRFDRITLVNKGKTERLTIDLNLRFHNLVTDDFRFMDNVVIIELKRDGLQPSPILKHLNQLRIKPHGFSKYCMGSALTNEALRRNRFKPKLHDIDRLLEGKSVKGKN